MNVVGKRICEDVVNLSASSTHRIMLGLGSVLPTLSHFVKIFPILLHFLLLLLFLVPSYLLWNFRTHLELFLLTLLAIPGQIFLLPPFFDLRKQLILVGIFPFGLHLSCFHFVLLVPLPLVVDVGLDECVLHCVSFGEWTDVGFNVLCLVAH